MNMNDLIGKKRDGGKLSQEEIEYFVKGYTDGSIPDYQMSALLMAIYFQKMDKEETFHLTRAMKQSGDVIDLSAIKGIKVDKHSTGGVGDKTTLVVAPLAAACGVPIAKMSGRGLGFTGGTVDKMEAIPGFQTSIEADKFIRQVNSIGLSVIGQTAHIAPADKKIYALRDVTATVDNMSLISSSIMSKKLASGSDAIVLDVKCGDGAFMESFEDACTLGKMMVEIGNADHKRTIAVITDMNQPLGRAVGNSLEVMEAIDTLKGEGPQDITELSLTLAGIMIYAGGRAESKEQGYEMAEKVLKNGEALKKLAEFIEGQGGNPEIVNDYALFPQHTCIKDVICHNSGYVNQIAAKAIGLASQHSGAGRATKEDSIDLSAGVYLHKKVGDTVEKGEILATVYGTDAEKVERSAEEAEKAFSVSAVKPEQDELIKMIII
ncbi:MAG: pyrimidine-nucleoside phosphorylase [Clostridiales bacterium]|jgi:pyrimidine-nucleoside phosphorylase|uniref:pyrimidine-nucleoside phosphorylase n=1 Tax=Aminipila sp. TaxID=2060095 RepID=UPI001D78B7EC|nr:pyrimidine-nucleoside phosphorylase [Aminipila sp.]MBE6034711.1 pyrimidine-nucleoside phosphorylase [Clostridiales bacterium]